MGRIPSRPWFFPGSTPSSGSAIRIDSATTPRALTVRTIAAAPRHLVPAALLTSAHQIGEGLVPVVVGRAVDTAVGSGDPRALLFWIVVLAVVFCGLSFSYRFGSRIGFLGMNSVQHDIRMLVTDTLLSPAGVGGPGQRIGNRLSVATSDTTLLANAIGLGIYGPAAVAGVLICAVVLFTIWWPLALAVIIGATLILVLGDLLGGVLRRRIGSQQAAIADAAGTATDLVHGLRVIKGLGAQQVAARRYAGVSAAALERAIDAAGAQARSLGVLQVLSGLFVVAIAVASGWLALRGTISAGELITVVMLTQWVMEPIGSMAHFVNFFWNPAVAAAARVLTVLRAGPSVTERVDAQDLAPTTQPRGLRLDGPDGLVEVHPGEQVALSTDPATRAAWAAVLGRTADNDQLRARITTGRPPHGPGPVDPPAVDIASLTLASVRRAVLVVPHEAPLFAGTVLDNVTLGGDADPAPALEAAQCDQVARMLPEGLATEVGDQGHRLSGGQRQRVGLARALYADPDILVLLDPTSAVDSVTEDAIARATAALRRGRTTLVITDSPAWARHLDRVVRLDSAGAA